MGSISFRPVVRLLRRRDSSPGGNAAACLPTADRSLAEHVSSMPSVLVLTIGTPLALLTLGTRRHHEPDPYIARGYAGRLNSAAASTNAS